MRPPNSIIGTVVNARVLREPGKRRLLFAVLIAICIALTLFPQEYRSAVSLTPVDPTSLGLNGSSGSLGSVSNLLGNQPAIEVSLKVARSQYVRGIVARRMDLAKRLGKSPLATDRWLDRQVDVRALRGGILQFEVKLRDAALGQQIVATYADAVREQMGIVARNQNADKRKIVIELVDQASAHLEQARTAYDTFRLTTRYPNPQRAISAVGDRVPALGQMIQSKEVELSAAREFGTDDNFNVRQIVAEIAALKAQLDSVRSTSPAQQNSVGMVVRASTQTDRLRRDLDVAQRLYDNYVRLLQATTADDLGATANVRVLEPAYIDTERQYNLAPMALAVLLVLLAVAIEFYTIRPPLLDRNVA